MKFSENARRLNSLTGETPVGWALVAVIYTLVRLIARMCVFGLHGWSTRRQRRPYGTALEALLVVLSGLLPQEERARYCEEWCAELESMSNAWTRARYVAALAVAMPRLTLIMRMYPRSLRGESRYRRARR